jgi:hypothetical protein
MPPPPLPPLRASWREKATPAADGGKPLTYDREDKFGRAIVEAALIAPLQVEAVGGAAETGTAAAVCDMGDGGTGRRCKKGASRADSISPVCESLEEEWTGG